MSDIIAILVQILFCSVGMIAMLYMEKYEHNKILSEMKKWKS